MELSIRQRCKDLFLLVYRPTLFHNHHRVMTTLCMVSREQFLLHIHDSKSPRLPFTTSTIPEPRESLL